ncbi:MAG: hypothetical protein J2P37_32065, partial [Ktedonobacteraceae bacterium]|nr:hypothetical protein [Ktedonobacteraceae bacterium]
MLTTYHSHHDHIFAVAWSPVVHSGSYLIASGGRDRSVRIWDPSTGATQRIFQGHTACILSLAWSPDGRHLASGCTAGIIHVWEVFSG